jgi:hypothetical protein
VRRFGNWFGMSFAILVVGAFLGLSLYLDIASAPAPGEVVDKQETIRFGSRRAENWTRRTTLEVRYQPPDHLVPLTAIFDVDLAMYDRLQVGSPVVVRYPDDPRFRDLLFLPLARLDGQTTWTVIRTSLPPDAWSFILLIVGGVILFKLWTWLRGRIKGLGWLLVAYLIGAAAFLLIPWPGPAETGPREPALATVRAIRQVSYIPGSRNSSRLDLLQPYELVVLEYVPEGRSDPVVAVDAIDAGSVPGLARGSTVAVAYAVDDVRSAIIEGGRHAHRVVNLISWVLFWFGGIALSVIAYFSFAMLRQFFSRRMAVALDRARQGRGGSR